MVARQQAGRQAGGDTQAHCRHAMSATVQPRKPKHAHPSTMSVLSPLVLLVQSTAPSRSVFAS
jgi:hypothetical protein